MRLERVGGDLLSIPPDLLQKRLARKRPGMMKCKQNIGFFFRKLDLLRLLLMTDFFRQRQELQRSRERNLAVTLALAAAQQFADMNDKLLQFDRFGQTHIKVARSRRRAVLGQKLDYGRVAQFLAFLLRAIYDNKVTRCRRIGKRQDSRLRQRIDKRIDERGVGRDNGNKRF